MNKMHVAVAVLSSVLPNGGVVAQQPQSPIHTIIEAGEVDWKPAPPSVRPGAQAAVLFGDPSKAGPFIIRLKLPAGYRIAPHSHPTPESSTVISGVFNIGMGPVADESKARRLPAGSFFAFDGGMPHYAFVEEDTVVQLSGMGPWTMNYVNPADDPRLQPKTGN